MWLCNNGFLSATDEDQSQLRIHNRKERFWKRLLLSTSVQSCLIFDEVLGVD
jgi:hypothetical protein